MAAQNLILAKYSNQACKLRWGLTPFNAVYFKGNHMKMFCLFSSINNHPYGPAWFAKRTRKKNKENSGCCHGCVNQADASKPVRGRQFAANVSTDNTWQHSA